MHNLQDVIDSEIAVLGSAVLDPSLIDVVGESIQREDWTTEAHGRAWRIMSDFRAAGGPVNDVRQLVRVFTQHGLLDALGGQQGLAEWARAIPGNLEFHLGVIRKAAQTRHLKGLVGKIEERLSAGGDPAAIATWIDSQLDAVTGERGIGLQTIGESATEALARIDKAMKLQSAAGISTGISELDKTVGGLFGGDLVIIAARPSVGKTALATQVSVEVAKASGPVLLASLEMKGHELAMRLIAKETGISMSELRSAAITSQDRQRVAEAAESIGGVDISLLYSRNVTVAKIRAAARLKRGSGGLAMVVVDYLGLVKPSDPRRPRHEQIAEASAGLKDLAMELEVPVVVLSQLNREADKGAPMLSHLRDSGAVEQDADIVMLLHRESKASKEATVDVAKNRQGATGLVTLNFDPSTTTFSNQTTRDDPNYHEEFDDWSRPLSSDDTPF